MGKYDTYILEMVKNNGICEMCGEDHFKKISHSHSRNELRYQKLEGITKKYTNYFLTNDIFNGCGQCRTARRILSLYQHVIDCPEKDPFSDNADAPFLILIQICLCRKGFQDFQKISVTNSQPDVEIFLKTEETKIQRIVEHSFNQAELKHIVFRIFRSSTTGDFCLAVRTARRDLIDKAAGCLSGCADILTYTTVWQREVCPEEDTFYTQMPVESACTDLENDSAEDDMKKFECNQALFRRIKDLNSYRSSFAQENRSFQDLFQATKELFWSYASSAWAKDTEINWCIWYNDMNVLCSNIEEQMKNIAVSDSEPKNRKLRSALLNSWRKGILAIDNYTRLAQGVNYQRYQAPIYETQTQIDAEKVMAAYREAMRVYYLGFEEHVASNMDSTFGPITLREPVIYSALDKEKVEVATLFANKTADFQPGRKLSVCTVPSFEYFGRLYDFLPLLMHEAGHAIRVMERKVRNQFLVNYTLEHVFRAVIKRLLQEPEDAKRYEDMRTATEDLLTAFIDVAKDEIKLDYQNADFEQTANVIGCYLLELFPKSANTADDSEKIRKKLSGTLAASFLSHGLTGMHDYSSDPEKEEELLERALFGENDKLKALLSLGMEDNSVLLSVNDFYLPSKAFDQRISVIRETWKNPEIASALNEYIFFTQKLYRLYKAYRAADKGHPDQEERRRSFFKKVFQAYPKRIYSESAGSPHDPEAMYFLNYMGLLGDNENIFYRQCKNAFDKISFYEIQDCKIFRTRIYREACADVMMAVSLRLDAFGYCRQIFRAISDTLQAYSFDRYESLDFGRFRTVAALLLLGGDRTSNQADWEEYGVDEYRIHGDILLEKGKRYCENYLKYIRRIIAEREPAESVKQLSDFLGDINAQLCFILPEFTLRLYKQTLLYVFLHGESENLAEPGRIRWKEYESLIKICEKYKQHFWRLECFCMGLHYIMFDGWIAVEQALWDHMEELYQAVSNPDSAVGCIWEKNLWPCMQDIKRKVGEYYNNPESILTTSSEEKLETTIDFIQNFYYHNRVVIVTEGESANGKNIVGRDRAENTSP